MRFVTQKIISGDDEVYVIARATRQLPGYGGYGPATKAKYKVLGIRTYVFQNVMTNISNCNKRQRLLPLEIVPSRQVRRKKQSSGG
jgi:hypothetical protein